MKKEIFQTLIQFVIIMAVIASVAALVVSFIPNVFKTF